MRNPNAFPSPAIETSGHKNEKVNEMFEGASKGPHVIHRGCAYPVRTQGVTHFNDAGGIPESDTPRLGHITDGVYYYPWTDAVMAETGVGFTKGSWAASGYEVFNT